MVEIRIKKILLSAMKSRFPKFIVKDFEIRKTFKYESETQNWVSDSYTLFIQVNRNKDNPQLYNYDVENFLTALFGFECCVDFI